MVLKVERWIDIFIDEWKGRLLEVDISVIEIVFKGLNIDRRVIVCEIVD